MREVEQYGLDAAVAVGVVRVEVLLGEQ